MQAVIRMPENSTFKYLPGKELLAGEKHLFERHTLEALKEKLDGRDLHFETTVSKKQENPPLPYNLTVLLSDMSERFGFTAAQTQQITQDLRDKYKAITYNRSDSPIPQGRTPRAGTGSPCAGDEEPRRALAFGLPAPLQGVQRWERDRPPRHHPAGSGCARFRDGTGRSQGSTPPSASAMRCNFFLPPCTT